VSSASATSTVLFKALMKGIYGSSPLLVPKKPVLAQMLEGASAALLIGDEALKERNGLGSGSGLFVYDLGRMWHEFAGLPFVYALWMVRENSARSMPELAERFRRDLLDAKEVARGSYGEIAADVPECGWMGRSGLVAYWDRMSYDLGEEHVKGLMKFYELAHKVGEIEEVPALRFL
jgi:chorismate dehydratase